MLRKILKIVVIVVVIAFGAMQFVRPNLTNPPVVESESLLANSDLPPDVRQVLVRSCGDCHSDATVYPWYSNVTPFNWFLADHIDTGKHEMNLSKWNTYTKDRQRNKLDEICEEVEGGFMPLPSYLWIHSDAALSDTDRKLLCGWAKSELQRIESGP